MKPEKRIRIGSQTSLLAARPTQPFEYAVQSGFDAFEWFPDKRATGEGWLEQDLDVETRLNLRRTAIDRDIRLSVHAPWWLNPANPNDLGRLRESIQFARDVGASLINVHLYCDQGVDPYETGVRQLMEDLTEPSMDLSIENTPITGPDAFNTLFARLGGLVGLPARVGMCLDLGHANLYEAWRNDYLRFIDQIDPHVPIIHIHAHENYGDDDTHLVLFTGPSARNALGIHGFVERMKKRAFSGSIILEQWPQPPSLLNHARDRLFHAFEDYMLPVSE